MPDLKNFPSVADAPALDAFIITPSASPLSVTPRAILIGTAGTLEVTTYKGTTLTLNVLEGILPLVVTHVLSGTASDLVGLV